MDIGLSKETVKPVISVLRCLSNESYVNTCKICDANYHSRNNRIKIGIWIAGHSKATINRMIRELNFQKILIKEFKSLDGKIAYYYTNQKYINKLKKITKVFLSEIKISEYDDSTIFQKCLVCLSVFNSKNCNELIGMLPSNRGVLFSDLHNADKAKREKLTRAKKLLLEAMIVKQEEYTEYGIKYIYIKLNVEILYKYIEYIESISRIIAN